MNIYSLPAIISFTINFSIALIVLLDQPREPINRWFAAFILSFAVWNISEIIILNSLTVATALFAAQLLYRIIFLTPAIFVIIAHSFPRSFARWSKKLWFHFLVFAIPVLLLSLSFPDFQIQLVSFKTLSNAYYYHFQYVKTPLFIALVLLSITYISWGSIVLLAKIPKLRTVRQKNQTRFLLFGILTIAVLFLIINSMRTLLEQKVSFYFLSTILSFVISLFFLAAIYQYKIVKISRVVRGGITYSILSSTVLIIYFIVVKSLSETLTQYFNIDSSIIVAIIIAILIIIIRPLESRLQQLIDRLLNKDINQYRHNFYRLSRELLTYMDTKKFFQRITNFLLENFQSEKIFVLLQNKPNSAFLEIGKPDIFPPILRNSAFVQQIFRRKMATEYYALNQNLISGKIHAALERQNIRLILPLIFEEQLLAIILLTKKRNGRDYTEDEIEILSIFSNEIAIALQRNMMIDELREQDRHQSRLQRLAALGQLTAGIAHEIRNPLNTISASAETMLRKKLLPEDESELKQFIVDEVNRLNRILQDFLKLSKLRQPNLKAVSMETLLNRVQLALETGEESDIQFDYDLPANEGRVQTDDDLFYQLLLNLGLNAIEAIKERCHRESDFSCRQGRIRISIHRRRNNRQLELRVTDNGVGIPQQSLESIYDPFFTTKENGTGLGLSIVYNIVELLDGRIDVQSAPGETVFLITLPAAKAGEPKKDVLTYGN